MPLLTMVRRRRPLLRASLELANAANGVQPFGRDGYPTIPAFFAGWPTTEMAPLYMTVAVPRGSRRFPMIGNDADATLIAIK